MPDTIHNSQFTIHHYLILALLLLLYLLVALAHDALAPLTTGPDELAHYEYVRFIADHGRLPLNYEERSHASYKSDQPPLYHLLAALPVSLVDPTGPPYLKRVSDHPRRQLIERTRHAWGLYNTEDERWPYRAEVLRWHIGRWAAILFGAATVAVTYFIARDLLFDPRLALASAAVVAFIPRYALTGSMLNYETTLAFFAALFLWMLLRISQSPIPNPQFSNPALLRVGDNSLQFPIFQSPISFILLGLFAGLAITAKLSAIIFPLEIIVAFWLIARHHGWGWKIWLKQVLITGGATLIAVSWWFGFVVYRFNTVARDGLWVGLLRPLIAADSSDATTNRLLSLLTGGQAGFTAAIENLDSGPPWEWLAIFFRTFWVVGIEKHQPLGWFGLLIALGLVVLAGYGIMNTKNTKEGTKNTKGAKSPRLPPAVYRLLFLHLAMAFVLPLVRYAITFSLADTAQGRHVLFQTAPAFAILLVWGVSRIPHLASRIPYPVSLPFLAPVYLLLWTLVQLWYMTWAYHPLLPVSTLPEAAAQAEVRLNRPMNDAVTLVGYTPHREPDSMPGVDLIWQATAISPVDYLTGVSLVDAQGEVLARWLGYPAGGRYPTRAWDVGDIVRDTVWLPLMEPPTGEVVLQVQLIPTARNSPVANPPITQFPIPLRSPAQQAGRRRVASGTPVPHRQVQAIVPPFQSPLLIWQNGRPVTAPVTFRYRETVLVTLSPELAGGPRAVRVIGPEEGQTYEPVLDRGRVVLFIVGPDWPTGAYRVQVTPETGQPVTSEPLIQVIDRWQRQFDLPQVSHPVEANFADQVKLLGYDLGANRAEAGGGIPITLYWQGLDWMGNDYTIFIRLIKTDDQSVHGGRDRLPREGYRTIYWAPGEVVSDPFGVPVDADAPDGIYHLSVGLYREVNGQAISLPLVQDGQPIEATSVNIGPFKIGSTPPGFTVAAADPQMVVNQTFGDPPALTLLGYDLSDDAGRPISQSPNLQSPISNLHLTLYWRVESTLPLDYTTFVHLRNAANEVVAQKDRPPLNGAYPTSLWEPGEIIADEIVVPLPDDLPSGDYMLVIGMYDFNTWARLPTPGNPADEVKLTDVSIR